MPNNKQVPNQKEIRVSKELVNGKRKTFFQVNQESLFAAMQNLKPNSFKLWCYLIKNQNGWDFKLSSKHACELCDMSRGTYNDCIEELIEKKYLVCTDTKSNRYICYELPQEYKEAASLINTDADFQF